MRYIVPINVIKIHTIEVEADNKEEAMAQVVKDIKENKNRFYDNYNSYEIHQHNIKTFADIEGDVDIDNLSHLF